jgi:hypothetical protein
MRNEKTREIIQKQIQVIKTELYVFDDICNYEYTEILQGIFIILDFLKIKV